MQKGCAAQRKPRIPGTAGWVPTPVESRIADVAAHLASAQAVMDELEGHPLLSLGAMELDSAAQGVALAQVYLRAISSTLIRTESWLQGDQPIHLTQAALSSSP